MGSKSQYRAGQGSWGELERPSGLSAHPDKNEGATWSLHPWGEGATEREIGSPPRAQSEKSPLWHLIGFKGSCLHQSWRETCVWDSGFRAPCLCQGRVWTAGRPFLCSASLSWSLCTSGPRSNVCCCVTLFSANKEWTVWGQLQTLSLATSFFLCELPPPWVYVPTEIHQFSLGPISQPCRWGAVWAY